MLHHRHNVLLCNYQHQHLMKECAVYIRTKSVCDYDPMKKEKAMTHRWNGPLVHYLYTIVCNYTVTS